MGRNVDVQRLDWRLLALILFLVIMPLLIGRTISSGSYAFLLFLIFSIVVLFLYFKQFELLILLSLIINHNIFYLLPMEPLGRYSYGSLLPVVLFLTIVAAVLMKLEKRDAARTPFGLFIISFLIILAVGVLNSYAAGQSLTMGLKKAMVVYFPALFYFVFLSKRIEIDKLLNYIVITGVCLSLFNNLQYLFYDKFRIFYYSSDLMRAGHLRFLVGGFFTIYAPLVSLSLYLIKKKKIFLLAFIYMLSTVILQGQTRAVILGFIVAVPFIFYLARRIDMKRIVFFGIPFGVVLYLLIPVLQSSQWGDVYQLTQQEILNREGNWGGRLDAYNYYAKEVLQSPIIGRGIWNDMYDAYLGNNPEDRGASGFGLPDIGIMTFLFRFGLVGAIWLALLFSKVYRTFSAKYVKAGGQIPYFLVGYFLFGLTTLLTIDCFTQQEVIIYLALNLALLSQMKGNGPACKEDAS
jgi:hypothetical protein